MDSGSPQDDSSFDDASNLTLLEFLELYRGFKQQNLDVAIPLTVFNGLIFITGLLGNIAVCIVIIKHSSLHTATNYYLFNLAVSDLTLLIFGLPNDVAYYWHQYPWVLGNTFCKLRALVSEMSSYVSVLTIVAFSTERYLAICYPLYVHTMSGLKRAIWIISCLWIVSFFSALPFALVTKVEYLEYPPHSGQIAEESAFCAMLTQPPGVPLTELSALLFFAIPAVIIAFQYTKMALAISKSSNRSLKGLKGSVHRDSKKTQLNKAVIRMLSAVVVAFFICWAPFHAQRLLYIYASNSQYYENINTYLFFVTGFLYYLSSTLNPLLYNLMSDKMRNAFKDVLCGKNRTRTSLTRTSTFKGTHSYHIRLQESSNQVQSSADNDEDKLNLTETDIVGVNHNHPKMESKLIYVSCDSEKCKQCNRHHDETCI